MLVTGKDVETGLRRVALRLEWLLSAVWLKEDTRFTPAADLLTQAVWKTNKGFPLEENPIKIKGDKVYNLTSEMQGRVLTIVEMLFAKEHQCEAFKSQARQAVWGFQAYMSDVNKEEELERT